MSKLRLWLLGSPRLERDGAPLKMERRKAIALLAYLALRGGDHSREALAALFYPDYTERRAYANLRRILWTVKDALGEDWVAADQESIGLARGPEFWLDVDEVQRLLVACGTHGHPASEVCPDCLPPLGEAANLYRDDFMAGFTLPDCPEFDEWQFFQRESLRREMAGALERLVRGHSARGGFELAIPYARRWLALDPFHEPAQRQLMLLYAWTGQGAAASRQYRECVRVLEEEVGVRPSTETTALYEAIKAQRPPPPPWAEGESQGQTLASASSPPAHSLTRTSSHFPGPGRGWGGAARPAKGGGFSSTAPVPFVARERELARLDEFLGLALAGRGRVVFLTGEAGTGRTALAHEFARRAQVTFADLVVASGNCDAHTGIGNPYLPFRQVLSLLTGDVEARWAEGMISQENASRLWDFMSVSVPALVDLGPDLIGSLVPGAALASRAVAAAPSGRAGWLQRLEELVAPRDSSLRESQDTAASPGSAGLEQGRIFAQVTEVLQALAAKRPLLLILDDLHWADLSSISLLFHLGQHIGQSRTLIVGSYRPEDVAQSLDDKPHPLQAVLSEFKRRFGDIWVDLDQASADAGRQFVDALLDAEPNRLGQPFRKRLFRRTGGHALFTTELLRDMRERGDLVLDEAGRWVEPAGPGRGGLDWKTLPARVEGVIEKRIARLPVELRQALLVASVEGEEFTAEVVARVQEMDEQDLVRRLSAEAVRQHRLVSAPSLQWLGPQQLSRYRFRHNLFHRYLYHTLDEAERSYLHGQVGVVLEALYAEQAELIAGRLAWHFEQAGLAEKAVDYLLQAGERALRLSAHQEAVGHLTKGLALLEALPEAPTHSRRELALRIALGSALVATKGSGAPEAERTLLRARELSRQLGKTAQS